MDPFENGPFCFFFKRQMRKSEQGYDLRLKKNNKRNQFEKQTFKTSTKNIIEDKTNFTVRNEK